MTQIAPEPGLEEMLRELLDRQRRSDARLEAVEAALAPLTKPTREDTPATHTPPLADTVPLAKMDTPLAITWVNRKLPPLVVPTNGPSAKSRSGGVIQTPPPRIRETPGETAKVTFRKPKPASYSAMVEEIQVRGGVVNGADVLASIDDVVWSISLDGGLVYFVAGAVEKIFGQSAQTLRDKPGAWLESFPTEDRGRLHLALRRITDTDVFTLEHRLEVHGRTPRYVVTRGRLVRSPDGRPLRVDGVTADFSEHTRTERALSHILHGVDATTGDDFLAKMVEHLALATNARISLVATIDPADPLNVRTVAAWADGAAIDNFELPVHDGVGRDLAQGSPVHIALQARERLPQDELLAMLRASTIAAEPLIDSRGQIVGMLAVADDRAIRPAIPDVHQLVRAVAPRTAVELGRRKTGTGRCDKLEGLLGESERRRREGDDRVARLEAQVRDLEEQLQNSRRLETIGRLVAGVAHDFNNMLTLICGNAELVREGLPAGDKRRDAAEQVVAAGHSAAALTRQLLALARPSPAEPRPVDLNAIVRSTEKMVRRLVGESLTLTVNLSPSVELVRADPVQVEQILFNLVANARDAIGAGSGSVVVRTADAVIEPNRPGWPDDLPTGGYVALTVSDTGCGMSDDVKARLFEPFFTTKSAENGTGLGLANVRDIVRRSSGHVEVESAVGWGTSVRIYWPKLATYVPDTLDEAIVVPVGPKQLGRGETVLLVEDDTPVRELARAALQQAGYRVLEAADAESGEERARLFAGPIGLLIADVGLPGRDGVQLAAKLRAVRQGLKVLYISGYPAPEPLPADAIGEFLAKPYTPQRLLEVVRDAIGVEQRQE